MNNKKTLHDVIAVTYGEWAGLSDVCAMTKLGVLWYLLSDERDYEFTCCRADHDLYIAEIERDYNQYKEDYMRHHHKPFAIKQPSIKWTAKGALNLPRSRRVEINAAGKVDQEAATKTQNAFDDPEEHQRAIESHAASYTKLCEFVDKHNLRSGSDLAVDLAIDAIAKVHDIDMRSDEEKLVDELENVISGFGVLAIPRKHLIKALLANYNITKKD